MLKKFSELNAVSGNEKEVRDVILSEIEPFIDCYEIDSMGNLIAYKNSCSDDVKTVILCAHMDEVGLIVTGITESGMLKFDTVGGIETPVLISKKVKSGNICGVIGIKPFHRCTSDERNKSRNIDDLYIDIGALSKSDAEKYVMPGDYFSFDSKYTELGERTVKGKAFDDRVGCIAIIEALKEKCNCNLICIFTVQEETGLRGAKAALYGKKADYALVIECTTAGDITNTKPHMKVTKLGEGAAISVMDSASVADRQLCSKLKETAEKNGIKYQFKKAATGGNDAGMVHIANGGIKTCSISVPARYIHSPSSVISLDDFEEMKKLVRAFLKEL